MFLQGVHTWLTCYNHTLSTVKGRKKLLVEFGVETELNSIDRKLILKLDTGSDVNPINWKTFKELFPDVQLQHSVVILENFDSTCVRLVAKFKCFLCWKHQKYRIDIEVMEQTWHRKRNFLNL